MLPYENQLSDTKHFEEDHNKNQQLQQFLQFPLKTCIQLGVMSFSDDSSRERAAIEETNHCATFMFKWLNGPTSTHTIIHHTHIYKYTLKLLNRGMDTYLNAAIKSWVTSSNSSGLLAFSSCCCCWCCSSRRACMRPTHCRNSASFIKPLPR